MNRTSLAERYPTRAAMWQLRTRMLRFEKRPLIMGIVNVTPDSFSDGGKHFSTIAAVDHALRLLDEGADILDIGGESTRPYATPVSVSEELRRTAPVIEAIHQRYPAAVLSIDTSKAEVAKAAVACGAEIINDISGMTSERMIDLARSTGAGICAMHMQGTPQTMQDNPFYEDVVEDIYTYLCERRDALLQAGVQRERICLDPGVGFGKTHQHNLTLMAHCERCHDLCCPLLVGHSRKGFISKVIGDKHADRTAGTIGGALALAQQGIQIIRVHEVRPVREALLLFEACGGIDGTENCLESG